MTRCFPVSVKAMRGTQRCSTTFLAHSPPVRSSLVAQEDAEKMYITCEENAHCKQAFGTRDGLNSGGSGLRT